MRASRYAAVAERRDSSALQGLSVPAVTAGVQEKGIITGFASVFGVADLGNDIIEPGSFSDALARRGPGGIRMLFQHDPSEPVGVWHSVFETAGGLVAEGKLSLGSTRVRDLAELIAEGAIDGLSIGFRTIRAKTDPASGARHILEADLWEISIVTFPMQEAARITSVKATGPDISPVATRIRDAAALLRNHQGPTA